MQNDSFSFCFHLQLRSILLTKYVVEIDLTAATRTTVRWIITGAEFNSLAPTATAYDTEAGKRADKKQRARRKDHILEYLFVRSWEVNVDKFV